MKKILLFLYLSFLFVQLKATHTLGGEISWECLSDGKYQFKMKFFRDCSGIPWQYGEETIDILGNPLPKNAFGNPISSILMKPDSLTFINNRNGNTAPICDSSTGTPISCSNQRTPTANGFLQVFYYVSNPILLVGRPPLEGWHFRWQAACCRPGNIENLNTPGPLILRASMFRLPGVSLDSCIDSSPQFVFSPASIACRGDFTVNLGSTAIDPEQDSLVYRWATPIGPPIEVPGILEWKSGYSESNPLPDKNFDPENIPAKLDPQTGVISFKINSGAGRLKYVLNNRVDAYREGIKIASVYREYPISVFDCDQINNTQEIDQPFDVFVNGTEQQEITLNHQFGEKISFPLRFLVNDSLASKDFTVIPLGDSFSDNFRDSTNCDFPPCPYLKGGTMVFDSLLNQYVFQSNQEVTTELIWNTKCNQLDRQIDTLFIKGPNSRTFNFFFQIKNNQCPVPRSSVAVISIRLHSSPKFTRPKLCIRNQSGQAELSWQTNLDAKKNFRKWKIYASDSLNGNFFLLDSILDFNQRSYRDSAINKERHYFIRSEFEDNCLSEVVQSQRSDTVSNFFANLSLKNQAACIRLKWKGLQASVADGLDRTYRIYREFPIGSGFQLVDSVKNDSVYCDFIAACDQRIRYQVRLLEPSCKLAYETEIITLKVNDFFVNNFIEERNQKLIALAPFGSYQWYDCGKKSIIPAATEKEFTPTDTGVYALIITQFACRDTSECIPFFPVGIEEANLQEVMSYYPNPTDGELVIEFGEKQEVLQLSIRNIHGQLLLEETYQAQNRLQLQIPGKAGLYLIQLTNQKGERANLKLVKRK